MWEGVVTLHGSDGRPIFVQGPVTVPAGAVIRDESGNVVGELLSATANPDGTLTVCGTAPAELLGADKWSSAIGVVRDLRIVDES